MVFARHLTAITASLAVASAQCPDYLDYSETPHGPYSEGRYNLSYQRPDPSCRTFTSSVVEDAISRVKGDISDPDLRRLFENTYPNTMDTAVKWKGTAEGSDEELTFLSWWPSF
jgi:hypothetical protein